MNLNGFVPPDCSGVCLPEFGAATVDVLRSVSAQNTAGRVLRLLKSALSETLSGDDRRLIESSLQTIEGLTPLELAYVFDPLPACADAPIGQKNDDAVSDSRSAFDRAVAAARYLIGTVAVPELTIVLPPAVISERGLYLPHLQSLLFGPGPVAVIVREGCLRFTWPDGTAITLPFDGGDSVSWLRSGKLVRVPQVRGATVFNGVPEVAVATRAFGLCRSSDLDKGMYHVANGIAFLENMWPAAASAAKRHLKGLMVLGLRDHSRSHSPRLFQGMVLVSAENPLGLADLLVHELSHIRLNLLLEFDPLFRDREPERRHASPWRPDPRPLLGLVLGAHAFLNICHYYRRASQLAESCKLAVALFERQRKKVQTAWDATKPFIEPTALGQLFFTELEREVQAL
jgi:HEXXH motif-containing protein